MNKDVGGEENYALIQLPVTSTKSPWVRPPKLPPPARRQEPRRGAMLAANRQRCCLHPAARYQGPPIPQQGELLINNCLFL